jgi:hypothetical protein
MKRLLLSSMALLGVVSLSSTALAAGPAAKEMSTAAVHARLAEASQSVEVTDMHLHHVINCLVGSHGEGFDAAAGNPCQKLGGHGALRDAKKHSELYSKAKRALEEAHDGLGAHDLSAAHAAAHKVAEILK